MIHCPLIEVAVVSIIVGRCRDSPAFTERYLRPLVLKNSINRNSPGVRSFLTLRSYHNHTVILWLFHQISCRWLVPRERDFHRQSCTAILGSYKILVNRKSPGIWNFPKFCRFFFYSLQNLHAYQSRRVRSRVLLACAGSSTVTDGKIGHYRTG